MDEKNKNNGFSKVFRTIIVVVILLIIGLFGYLYYKSKQESDKAKINLKEESSASQSSNQKSFEAGEIKEKLSKILNTSMETKEPAIATVSDPEKLKVTQPEFYKNVEKDDYLIVYPSRAIIYRDSINQIINIAPIVDSASSSSSS